MKSSIFTTGEIGGRHWKVLSRGSLEVSGGEEMSL